MANLKLGVTIGGNVAIHAGNYNNYAPTLTGGNASGTWNINITGSAATLTTARTITIGNTGKTFNGSSNLTWTLAEIGAQPAGSYLTSYTETDTLATVTSRGSTTTGAINVQGTLEFDTYLFGDGKYVINVGDSWLRLNQNGDFGSGVYTPYILRNDGLLINYGGGRLYNGLIVEGETKLGSGAFKASTDQSFGSYGNYTFRDAVSIWNPNGTSAPNTTTVMSIGSMSNGISLVASGRIDASGGNSSNWNTAYDNSITAVAVSGGPTKTLTLTQQDGGTLTATWSDVDTDTNTYLTSASFNTTNGVLTLTRNDSVTVTVDLDGRFYTQSESDGRYVNVTGDVMTGALGISTGTAGIDSFYVDGTYGRLFTVTDDLSDAVFSVNTISGLPIIEAYSDYSVKMGRYGQNDFYINPSGNTGFGTASPAYKVDVTGSLRVSANIYVGGYIEPDGQSMNLRKVNSISFAPNNTWNDPYHHGIMSTDLSAANSDAISINSWNDITLRIDSNGNNSASYVRFMNDTTGSNQFAYIGYDGSNYIASFNGNVFAGSSFRAPIFYDSDDTNYYMDPNSTSVLYSINANRIQVTNDLTTSSGQGRFGGWYTGTGYTGAAVEVGFSGSRGYVISYSRSAGTYQPLELNGSNIYIIPNSGNIYVGNQIIRQAAGQGWLSGNYASSETVATTGAIYSIGGSYYPTNTALNTMYGVGYTHVDQGQMPSGATSWGFYVAANGVARVWLGGDSGNIIATGNIYAETNRIVATQAWVSSQGYITSYSETDTLATVTARGNTTNGSINVNGNILMTGTPTTSNQGRMIDFTGFDKEGTTDFSDRAYISHTINTGGHAGSVLVISSENDADDGIAFITNASSKLKHNSNNIATETWVQSQNYLTSVSDVWVNTSGDTMTGQLFISSTNQGFNNLILKNNSTGSSMPTHYFQRFIARYNNDVNGTDVYHWVRDSWEYNITNTYSDITLGAINNGTTYVNLFKVSTDGHVYATNSFRAPIFYDSDNTSYYLDPTSTTSIRTVGSWRADSSAWDGEFSGKMQYHSNNWYIQGADTLIYRNAGGTNVFYVNQGGVATAVSDFRAPIFYDLNDTNYYVDPNGISNISQLFAVGKYHKFGASTNWDNGSLNGANNTITNVHFQGHDDFWIGAGNSRWYSSVLSGHHDLLINTMQSGGSNTRGITFTASSGGASVYRLGRWYSATTQADSYLNIDGALVVGSTNLYYQDLGTSKFQVHGTNGLLFSVDDDLSDSVFSANTISGLPVIEAFADYSVKFGVFNQFNLVTSGNQVAINSNTVDPNWALYVTDRSTAGGAARYTLLNPGMGFNLADSYAQLQLYGTNGAYLDFVTSSTDSNGRLMWNSNKFTFGGNVWGSMFNASGAAYATESYVTSQGYITSSGRAYPRRADGTNINFYWSGQSGQPTWLWGSNDGENFYVWNPSNFSVNYATTAGNADTVDSLHASDFVRAYTTSAGNIDSDWGQSFKTFDPVPSGTPPLASPNIRTINVGEDFNRRTQLAFDYASDVAYFRRRDDGGWRTWREFIHSGNIGSQSVSYATTAGALTSMNISQFTNNSGYLTSLPSHNHDDRYFTETESDARFQPLENQRLSTSNSPTFVEVYANNWFRNNQANEGLYNEATTMHWSSSDNGFWDVSSTNTESAIRFYTGGHKSALRGYVYSNSSSQIGFLTNGGVWSLRTDSSRNTVLFGQLTVGQDVGYSSIYMYDSDEGTRELHCNSNRIGFLTQAGSWGAYLDDSTNWFAVGSMQAPIFYDSNDTNYYVDAASTSVLNTLRVNNHIRQGNNQAFPLVKWGASGSSTGAVIIKLPGGSGNYGMVHMQINIYEYNGNNVSTVIVGGHNWDGRWYSYGAKTLGNPNKQIRLGFREGQYCVVIGDASSTWSYGTVSLVSINNGEFYNNVMDLSGSYSISQVADETFDFISENLNGNSDVPTADYANTAGSANSVAWTNVSGRPTTVSSFTNDSGYITSETIGTGNTSGVAGAKYQINDTWLRVNSDNRQYQVYGNSRTIIWRTDGNTNDHGGGGYAYIWYYGGSADGNRRLILDTNGDVWSNTYGWFHDYFQRASSAINTSNIGSQSVNYASSAGSATNVVTIQDAAPGGSAGKLWWESDTGKLKVYYNSAWVDASPIPDMSLYYAKAGGAIEGDVVIEQTLTVVGNTLVQGTFTETSDISLKDNIIPITGALDKVLRLNGVYFNKKETPDLTELGFIAQEVEQVIPELVSEMEDGIKTVAYSRVAAVLVETIKEQQSQIEELKNLVAQLSKKLDNL